jgi:hypothetical protein
MPQPDPPLARLLAEKFSSRQIIRFRLALGIVFWSLLVFARGSLCRTSKLARSLIHRAAIQAKQDREAVPREIAAHERRKWRTA